MRKSLKDTLVQIAKTRDKESYAQREDKVKYNKEEQERKVNTLLDNQARRGHWECTLKDLITNVDSKLEDKMTMGNHIDVKHMKNNMRRTNAHAYLVRKECRDWIYLSAMLAVSIWMEKGYNLDESLWKVTANGIKKSKYNWNTKDIDKILQTSTMTPKEKKPRKRGVKTNMRTLLSLKAAQEKGIRLIVDGKHLRKLEVKSLERRKISWSVQEVKHLETTLNITREMNQDTKQKVTTFTKEASEELKNILEEELKVTKEEARSKILKKTAKEKNPDENLKEEDIIKKEKEKDDKKRKEMKTTTVYMKCQICQHIAQTNTVFQESSKSYHFRALHSKEMKTNSDMMKSYFPVVKIIRK